MSNVPGVIPSAAARVPLIPTKRTRLEYSTVAKTDRAKIQINSDKIINNNYYSVLYSSIENNAEELGTNECIEKLLGASTSILNDLGVLNTPAMHKVLKLPKKIRKAIAKRRLAFKNMICEVDPTAKNQHFEKFKINQN
ncbi:hypothetical protein BB561_004647 [Smittium simulii]|uniref:Uncharacterized protein n=1 Tax=Smittium simulii TaxID=133385 RepID=A0A2T9YF01_9FUNG|nr:hypothetical protein BB561_004647 [Smittium simulii]